MSLIILIGPPCSGKTTFLNNYKGYKIISSDEEINLLDINNYNQNELNILGVSNSIKKINEYINSGEENIIYDSTNLTITRREQLFNKIKNQEITAINFISNFNNIYLNWEKRGKDIKIEMLLYLFVIFKYSTKEEGFSSILDIENMEKNDFKYLKDFLEGDTFNKEKILEENKDLKVLDEFWKKGNKNFFEEYRKKLEYLDDMCLEDKLALLYSDIKYFYLDFIENLDLTYKVCYKDFLDGFLINILEYKIIGIFLDKNKTIDSFNRFILIF